MDLVPSLCEDLLSSIDQPLKIAKDKVKGRDYLLCDYNRDGDSYRWAGDFSFINIFSRIIFFFFFSIKRNVKGIKANVKERDYLLQKGRGLF